MTMIQTKDDKPWYASIGMWGGILSIAAPAIGWAFHLTLGIEETDKIAVYLVGIFEGVGGILAIIGRARASVPIARPRMLQR